MPYWPFIKSSRPFLFPRDLRPARPQGCQHQQRARQQRDGLLCHQAPLQAGAFNAGDAHASSRCRRTSLRHRSGPPSPPYGSLECADIAEVDKVTAKLMLERESEISHHACASPLTHAAGAVGMAFSPGFRRTFSVRGVVSTVPIPILTTLHTPHPAGLGRHPHSLRRRRGGKRGGTEWLILLWERILRE